MNQVMNYLQNGSQYYPFGDKPNQEEYPQDGQFKPFIIERNQLGKLANTSSIILGPRKSTKLKTTEHRLFDTENVMQYKFYTDIETPKYDPITNYMTLIPNSAHDSTLKSIDLKSYTLNHNQVERGQQMKKQSKGINHRLQLIGKGTKNLSTQVPAIGIYSPKLINRHLPNIQIKSKSTQKLPEIYESMQQSTTPKKKMKHMQSEMQFAKQIAEINREVELQMKRNPNQKLSVQQFDINENMNLEEAEQMRNRMKQYFQNVKESLTKIKNLINLKR